MTIADGTVSRSELQSAYEARAGVQMKTGEGIFEENVERHGLTSCWQKEVRVL